MDSFFARGQGVPWPYSDVLALLNTVLISPSDITIANLFHNILLIIC